MQIRTQFIGDVAVIDKMPVSLYPYATKTGIRLLLALIVVYVVVVNVFRSPAQIKRLLFSIALVGFLIGIST